MSQSDLPIWAQDRAREWTGRMALTELSGWINLNTEEFIDSLAALLMEVALSEGGEIRLEHAEAEIRGLRVWEAAASINANAAKVHKFENKRLRQSEYFWCMKAKAAEAEVERLRGLILNGTLGDWEDEANRIRALAPEEKP